MFAPHIHKQAKKPEGKPERVAERREETDAPETNLLWQLVALRGGGFQPPADGGGAGAPAAFNVGLHRAPAGARSMRASFERELALASAALMGVSRGESFPAREARRFERSLGAPFRDVRVHTDDAADRAAQTLGARAVTTGRDIYFARGEYEPGTPAGDRLLAHELTHVTQERAASHAVGPRVSHPSDDTEREAARAESLPLTSAPAPSRREPPDTLAAAPPAEQFAAPHPAFFPPPHAGGILHRQIAEMAVLIPRAYIAYRYHHPRNEVVELQGHSTFSPSADLAEWIADMTFRRELAFQLFGIELDAALVNVRFGNLGTARIPMYVDGAGHFQSAGTARMELNIAGLGNEDPTVKPLLLFGVLDDSVIGLFGGVTESAATAPDFFTLYNAIRDEGARRLLEWRGLGNVVLSQTFGELSGGHLDLTPGTFDFDLADTFSGSGTFGIHDGTVTFDASASVHVEGLEDATLTLARDSRGNLSGTARMAVRLGGFDGSLLASFGRGVLDIRGTARYQRGGFDGTVTLLVTDEASAWAAVNGQLAQWPPPGGAPAPTLGPSGPSTAPGATGTTPAVRHVVAGWGIVEFRYKDWLRGRAQVIVDPEGDITSLGRVHVPRNIPVMDAKQFNRDLIDRLGGGVNIANVWDVVTVNLYGWGSIRGEVTVGPATLQDLHAAGAFSTKSGFPNHLTIGGAIEMRASAALTITLRGGVRVRVQVPVVGDVTERARFTVASTEVVLEGEGRVDAFARGEAAIHRTSTTGSDEADYLLSGRLTAGASMGFTFRGGVDVNIPFHSVRVLTFRDRHYTLGRLQGSVDFRDYKLGSGRNPPRLKPKGVDTDAAVRAMYRDIINDGSGIPSQPAPDDAAASWTPGPGDVVGPEGPDPDPPEIPTDPHFGLPTVPPTAPPAAPQGPAPDPSGGDADQGGADVDADVDAADTGPPDAGVDTGGAEEPRDAGVPIAGVPEAPPPEETEPPDPNSSLSLVVPFEMEGTPHQLILSPGPVLLMASERGPLATKLQLKREEVDRLAREPGTDPTDVPSYENQRNVLDELIREADLVEAEAARLGFGAGYTGPVPGLRQLASRIHGVAEQFGWHDITAYLGSDPRLAPDPDDEFADRFERPIELIRQAFANAVGPFTSPDAVRDVLRAFTSRAETDTLRQMLDMMAAGGSTGTGVADFFGRVSRIRNVTGVSFDLNDLFAAHLRGDVILDHGPLQSGIFLEDLVSEPPDLRGGQLYVGTSGGRMPARLLSPPQLDFVIVETNGAYRLVLGFEHTGLSRGRAYVYAAGEIRYNKEGIVTALTRRSGHYRPSERQQERALQFMRERGILSPRLAVDLVSGF